MSASIKNNVLSLLTIKTCFCAQQEPLNSDDDVSEDDTSDMFDTDNVVVCQYDKVSPSFILYL